MSNLGEPEYFEGQWWAFDPAQRKYILISPPQDPLTFLQKIKNFFLGVG